MSNETKCNPDLVRERAKCTFDVNELKHIFYGSEKATKERRHFEDAVLAVKELKDAIPEEYLSHKDRYENAVRKATILRDVYRDYKATHNKEPPRSYVARAVIKDISPFLLHKGMFVPTIIGQGTPEQQAEWLPKAESMQIIGTYAQTELGHGSFIRGLETIATYDPKTEEFILNNPTLSSFKWWPGGLGSTVNHCIVVASLIINGRSHGIHPFIVQIRDLETHKPLPGVKVGEIGPKMGFSTANNGFLGFDNFRIPRKNMLMKNAQVLKDGTFVKGINEKLTYGTMVMVRVSIVGDSSFYAAMAATIAIRYSAVRHQSHIKASEPEAQILDYLTQQHKLFIAVASSHVYRNAYLWMEKMYEKVMQELSQDNQDNLPELHASACCLKAVCSRYASTLVEECRLACGGHGYMTSSSLPLIYGVTVAAVTYEGERTVLLLQTARYLMKAWMAAMKGKVLSPSVSYLVRSLKESIEPWQNTPEGIVKGFQQVSAGKVKAAYETIQKHVKSGKDYEDAWNLASVQLVKASEAHSRAILCELSWEAVSGGGDSKASSNLLLVLQQLAQLYLIYWTLENSGDLLMYSNITKDDLIILRDKYEELLVAIRPNAVGLVDGFDLRDEILNSTLGSYDGRVYERLMEEALKSPLNQEPVNQSFHKYIKPMMQKAKI